jgi:predicted RNA-binding Zn ribbon-like protein
MATKTAAPGELELVRSFVNTLDLEGKTDELATVQGLLDWYRRNSLVDEAARLDEADRQRAVAVRDALRELLYANHGYAPDGGAVAAVNAALRAQPLVLQLHPDGAGFEPVIAGSAQAALGRVLGTVFRAMVAGTWSRLKICKSDSCRWAFYDNSRNRSRNWCSMAVCGNRTKVRAYNERARRRKKGTSDS